MKFGIMLPHYRQVASTQGIYRIAQEAESMGFHSVWVSDHIAVPDQDVERYGKGYYDLFSVLGYVSAITQRVSLGTSIVILPLRNPLHTAQV
ncbi:MAG: LLM class flavin-dependent oxidoreductase, partial [Chloroflexi bacterium]|nr:LLM class flavin-dependent oxidoreductase [Chloroflexota bacterium]